MLGLTWMDASLRCTPGGRVDRDFEAAANAYREANATKGNDRLAANDWRKPTYAQEVVAQRLAEMLTPTLTAAPFEYSSVQVTPQGYNWDHEGYLTGVGFRLVLSWNNAGK